MNLLNFCVHVLLLDKLEKNPSLRTKLPKIETNQNSIYNHARFMSKKNLYWKTEYLLYHLP
jgi:hypothetical protein